MAFLCECLALIFFSAWATTTKSCFNVGNFLFTCQSQSRRARAFLLARSNRNKSALHVLYVCVLVSTCPSAMVFVRVCSYLSCCLYVCMFDMPAMLLRHDGAIIKCGSHAKRVRANLKLANNFIIIILFMIVTVIIIMIFAIAVI